MNENKLDLVAAKEENHLQYSYGFDNVFVAIPFLMLLVSGPALVISIVNLVRELFVYEVSIGQLGNLLGVLISTALVIVLAPSAINQFSQIQVFEHGLRVRVFLLFGYRWITVSWGDVLDVVLINHVNVHAKTLWAIKFRRLTFWHKMLGESWRIGPYPVVIVSSEQKKHYELLDFIGGKIKSRG